MANDNQPVSRLKQYYVLRDYQEKNIGSWKQGEVIGIDPDHAVPYVGSGILTPLATAISTGIIPKHTPTPVKVSTKLSPQKPATTVEPSTKKTLVKNTLKEAIQQKKEALEPPPAEPQEVIVTSSDNESSTIPTKELSDQEKAIQAKIAALKKNK